MRLYTLEGRLRVKTYEYNNYSCFLCYCHCVNETITFDIIHKEGSKIPKWSHVVSTVEDIEPASFKGEAMRIDLNTDKPIFRPPHKLGQVE